MTAVDEHPEGPGPTLGIGPGVLDLAAALSIAVRIEPELIRAMRISLFPHLGVEAESDLWFHSELVRSRGSGGIVLDTQARATLQSYLRRRIEAEPASAPVHQTWNVLSRVHAHVSPALRVEEEINWLAVSGRASQIEGLLGPVLKAVADEGREGVARWFAAAWHRLPEAARETVTAWKLAQVSEALIPGAVKLRRTTAPDLATTDLADIVGLIEDTKIGVRRVGDEIELGSLPQGPDTFAIAVPNTSPRVLTLLGSHADSDKHLTVPVGGSIRARFDTPTAHLRTARGVVFEVPVRAESIRTQSAARIVVESESPEEDAGESETFGTIPDAGAPIFFLSYARAVSRRSESDRRVERLFNDLCDHLTSLVDHPLGAEIGFMDRDMAGGARWTEQLLRELGTCQVFVALTSVPFFESEWCGREWAAFAHREAASGRGQGSRETNIVPVVWAPNLRSRVPRAAAKVQSFQPSSERERRAYQEHGLLGLQATSRNDEFESYESVVWQLARHIAEIYYRNRIPPQRIMDKDLRNAFRDEE